jgi:hypothetical protein
MFVHWKDLEKHLGSPPQPAPVMVDGCGVVNVTERHIAIAEEHGGRCSFKLDSSGTTLTSGAREYTLGMLAYPDEE